MIFCVSLVIFLAAGILSSNGFLDTINNDEASFNMRTIDDGSRGILAKSKLEERRSFFHLFNVPYIVCYFAAKGKWPFIPSFMKLQVEEVGRSIFPQNDNFIRSYCEKWIQIKQCYRPHNIIPVLPDPPMTAPPEPIITDVETFPTDPPTTPCSCAMQNNEKAMSAPVVFFDKNYIGNVSAETITDTIEFLQSFLPPPTRKPKRRIKIRDRI